MTTGKVVFSALLEYSFQWNSHFGFSLMPTEDASDFAVRKISSLVNSKIATIPICHIL